MVTAEDPVDAKLVVFNPYDRLLHLTAQPGSFTLRRNARIKGQYGKQSKLRVSKRSLPADRGRKNTRSSYAEHETQLMRKAVLSDVSIQIIHITTFRTTFDFRSIVPRLGNGPILHSSPASTVPETSLKEPGFQSKPIFTVPEVHSGSTKTRLTDLPIEILHMILDQLFDPTEMPTHGRLAAFESASQVCSAWRSVILNRTFRVFYQLQKGRWRFDEFRYSPWEASFVYVPSWQLYHRNDCDFFGRGKKDIKLIGQMQPLQAESNDSLVLR